MGTRTPGLARLHILLYRCRDVCMEDMQTLLNVIQRFRNLHSRLFKLKSSSRALVLSKGYALQREELKREVLIVSSLMVR